MKKAFSRKISCELSPAELWRFLATSIRNSEAESCWPNELENSRAESLRVGGSMHVVYRAGPLRSPVTYRIMACDPDQHLFTYKATKDHPLKGGATVKIVAREGGGSELDWAGAYQFPWYSTAGAYFRFYFLDRFFARLEEGIRTLERRPRKRLAS